MRSFMGDLTHDPGLEILRVFFCRRGLHAIGSQEKTPPVRETSCAPHPCGRLKDRLKSNYVNI